MKKVLNGIRIVAICTIISKILSFVSELVIAKFLGTSLYADAYSMISGIHAVVYPMLGVGIWSIFLPEYKKMMLNKKKDDINNFSNKIITFFLIVSTIISIFIFAFSNQIISVVSPGFSEEAKNVASLLLKIYSPYFVFAVVSSVYAAMLQSNDKFFGSQVREIVSYLPTIILGPVLYNLCGVYGFAIALIFGGLLRLFIQLPFVDWGYRYKIDLNFKDNNVKKVMKKIPTVLISSATDQVHTLVDKIMASNLIVGSVSSLNYGSKLINAINGIFTNSIATVLYPKLAEMIGQKKYAEVNELFKKILISIAIVIIPGMYIGIIFSKDIVSLVYQRGSFDFQSVVTTSAVFTGYLVGIYFIGIKTLIDKFLYALDKNSFVMKLSVFNIITNIVLNLIFIKYFGLCGLAYATSLASVLYILISLFYLYKQIDFNFFNYIRKLLLVLFSNAIIIFGIACILMQMISNWMIILILLLVLSLICVVILYSLLKLNEFSFLKECIKGVIKK